jgi:hypothetical protein
LEGEYLGEDLEDTTSSCWRFREGKEGEEEQPAPPWMREREVGREK